MTATSSSSRKALHNKTNVQSDGTLNSFFARNKRLPEDSSPEGSRKRVRLSEVEHDNGTDSDASDKSDVELEDAQPLQPPRISVFRMMTDMHRNRPNACYPQIILPTRPILQSFVSANKADTYRCDSTRSDTHLTPPYACSYSHVPASKRGEHSLLAVATEEGTVNILNTKKRHDWDHEPQRTILQPHQNGIFDVKWHRSDTLIATTSGDHSTTITSVTRNMPTANLEGHTSTVKCVAWDPEHSDLLCTGGRDGNALIWDLRVGEGHARDSLSPVIVIPRAHEDVSSKPGPKSKKVARSVTSLTYIPGKANSIVSSGSFDGILREWDIRVTTRKTKTPKKQTKPVLASPMDPTVLAEDSRRARGITDVSIGTGASQGLLFALGNDSCTRTYHAHSLDALPNSTFSPANGQTYSFYVKSSVSPCGRWLSTGSSREGKAFLYDISNAPKRVDFEGMGGAVELKGHVGEVGAIDWAADTLATASDDGTVKVWRPDIEIYNRCIRDPEEEKWNWTWAQ